MAFPDEQIALDSLAEAAVRVTILHHPGAVIFRKKPRSTISSKYRNEYPLCFVGLWWYGQYCCNKKPNQKRMVKQGV